MNITGITDYQQKKQIIADLWREAFLAAIADKRSEAGAERLACQAVVMYEEMLDRRILEAEKAEKEAIRKDKISKGKFFTYATKRD